MLVGGREKDAIRHVMEMYRPALAAYFAGSSFRHRFQSDETPESAVNGFFGDQMGRPGFLSSWLQARSRFRYWLLVSFVNHMRHRLRQERSEERRREKLARNSARTSRDVVRDQFDAQLARGLVRAAMLEAERICRAEGREQDWLTFLAHFIDDRPYGELAAAEGVGTREIANRVRFAQKRLVKCMLETLSLNGSATREELHRELSHLEEAMSRWRS
jgi:DNA-directed RNA polymerase specialized sigma24 family protein